VAFQPEATRTHLPTKVLAHLFGDLFTPHRIAYLSRAVDVALRDSGGAAAAALSAKEAALVDARRELANVAEAIRQGVITPTARTILEEVERRVARLEASVQDLRRQPAPVVSLEVSVRRYLDDPGGDARDERRGSASTACRRSRSDRATTGRKRRAVGRDAR
jgi:hypothetical protein